jgi:hypothetical protein
LQRSSTVLDENFHPSDSSMASPFQTEAWSEYGVGMVVLITRICARLWAKGLALDGDDYFAALSIIFFTAELVMLELIGQYGSITGMNNEIALTLTPAQTERLRIGSKLLLAGWILYTTLIWCREYLQTAALDGSRRSEAYAAQSRLACCSSIIDSRKTIQDFDFQVC